MLRPWGLSECALRCCPRTPVMPADCVGTADATLPPPLSSAVNLCSICCFQKGGVQYRIHTNARKQLTVNTQPETFSLTFGNPPPPEGMPAVGGVALVHM